MKDILQLIKKENNQEYKDIYPKTFTDAVLDKHTGANLADILNSFNMYFIAYAGSKEVTRVLVPTNLRRKGLWVTYIMLDDTIVTEYYNGSLLTDDAWLDSANWVNSMQPFDKFSKKNMTCRFDNFTDKSTSSKLMTVKQGGEIVFSTTDNRFYYLHRDVLYAYWEVKGKPSNTEFQYKDSVYTDKLFLCKDRAYVMYNGTLVDIARFTIDKELSLTSNNPIANSTVTKKINEVNADATTALTLARELKEEGRFLINGNVTNNPDEEDITVEENKLKFKDKEYNAGEFSGLGRVYLRKNIVNGKNVLTQEMINKPNTIYIIQYDYDLDNKQINVLENCTLYFQGGSLNNGILNGNYTDIISSIFIIFKDNLNIKGNWNINNAYPEWFGAIPNNNNYDNSFAINKCLSAFNKCVLTKGFYYVSSNNGESCINIEKYNILTSNINVSDYNINIENLINKIGIRIIENTNCKQIINCKGSINNIYIIGNKKTIGVYCKGSKINIDNVNILNSTIGLYTNTYVSVYKSIICALCDIGFKIEGNYLDDVLQTQNTSCTLINCYSSQNNYCGFYLKGMIYSSLINCACDNTMKYDKNNYLASYKLDDCSSINLINCGIEHTLKAIIMNKVVSSSIFIHCISNYTNINDVDSELIKSFAIFKYISSCVINIYYNISNFNFDKQFIILKDYDRDITNLFLQVRYNNINFETDGNLQNIIRKIKRNTLCLRGFNELIKSIFIALPTKERPDNVENGYSYLDTTLNKKVYYNNNNWIDYNGNPADALKKGTTAQRPTGVQIGFTYKDTDLNKWIIWNGDAWENIDGTALG